MKATVNPVDQHVVTLTIEVPAAEVDKGIKQAVKRIASQVNIPGFRKGHAPRRILEMNFGKDAIMEEAFEVLASQTTVLHFVKMISFLYLIQKQNAYNSKKVKI